MTLHVIKWQTHVLQNRFTLSHVWAHTQQAIHINERSSSTSPPQSFCPFPMYSEGQRPAMNKDITYTMYTLCIFICLPLPIWFMPSLVEKKVTHDSEGWRVPPTVGSEAKVNSPGPGHFIALSISRGLRGGWTEVSSYYSWQRNKTTVSPGRARAAKKEPKMRQIVQEDLGDGRRQRWKKKKKVKAGNFKRVQR